MRVEIRSRGLRLNDEMRVSIKDALHDALAWFDRRISGVYVYLADRKTPYSGLRCRIVVEVPRAGRIVVFEENPSFSTLVERVAQRAGQAVQRHFERRAAKRLRRGRRRNAAMAVA